MCVCVCMCASTPMSVLVSVCAYIFSVHIVCLYMHACMFSWCVAMLTRWHCPMKEFCTHGEPTPMVNWAQAIRPILSPLPRSHHPRRGLCLHKCHPFLQMAA